MRMNEMNKSTLAAFGIAIGLAVLAVGVLIGVWAGCSPILLSSQGNETVVGEVTASGEDAVITLYPFGKDSASRSVTGPSTVAIQAGGQSGLINYIQLIVMEDTDDGDGTIAAFADADAGGSVSVTVATGKKYHLLYLWGRKNGLSDPEPTLLVSAYGWVEVKPGDNPVIMPLVPLVVDTAIYPVEETSPLAYTTGVPIAATAGVPYRAVVKLGAKQSGTAASGDGLWPLKLANPETRRTGIHGQNKGTTADGSFEKGISAGGYSGGNAANDAVNTYLANAAVTLTANAGYYGTASSSAGIVVSESIGDTGSSYAFTPEVDGRFYFTMKYTPFAVTAAEWTRAAPNAPTWVIRGGLNDAAQDTNTDFTVIGGGKNGNGAIPVAVGNPTIDPGTPWPGGDSGGVADPPTTDPDSGATAILVGSSVTITAVKANSLGLDGSAANAILTIELGGGAMVRTALTGMAVTWVETKPAGLTFAASAYLNAGRITIAVGGIPQVAFSGSGIKIVLPANTLMDRYGVAIPRALTVTGTVTYNIGQAEEPKAGGDTGGDTGDTGGGTGNTGSDTYPIPQRVNKSIKDTFGITTAGAAGVTETFNVLHAYLSGSSAAALMADSQILLGDYIDLPRIIVDGSIVTDAAIPPSASPYDGYEGRVLRLLVVGINAFNASGDYTGNGNGSAAHLVFQFQNVAFQHPMNPTDTNVGGYKASDLRSWLTSKFLPGLVAAGVPSGVLWGPKRYVANRGSGATAADLIDDILWLPTEREMLGTWPDNRAYTFWSHNTYETPQNQAHLEYYPNPGAETLRIKYTGTGSASMYALASPLGGGGFSATAIDFCAVNSNGDIDKSSASSIQNYVAPAFCVR